MLLLTLLAVVVALATPTPAVSPSDAQGAPSPAVSETPRTGFSSQNRAWWIALDRNEKLRVVEGEIDGLINGWWRAFVDYDTELEVFAVDTKFKNSADWATVDKFAGKIHQKFKDSPPRFSKKFGYYIDATDDFYKRYPNADNVSVGNIMQCLSDKPWRSCPDVAKLFSSSKVR